ncbi:MAG: hypothetical protein ACFBSD_08935, partial [Paracoccaceae bacterium]
MGRSFDVLGLSNGRFGARLRQGLGGSALAVCLAATAAAQTQPLNIVYGPEAASRDGDANNRDRLYITEPAHAEGPFYVRL